MKECGHTSSMSFALERPYKRHYNSELSIWLSVDPMADKYPGVSPYAYCGNNPVRLVDPNGDTLRFAEGTTPEFQQKFKEAINHLNDNGLGGIASYLHKSDITYYIQESSDENSGFSTNKIISWNPAFGLSTDQDVVLSPTTILNHELTHALIYDLAFHKDKMKEFYAEAYSSSDPDYGSKNEMYVITGVEQRTAKALGEIKDGQVTRTNHLGTLVKTKGVTSNEVIE